MPPMSGIAGLPASSCGASATIASVVSKSPDMGGMGRNWQKLHNMAYVVATLGVWHYWWQVKKDIAEPLVYATVLAVLLGARIWWRWQRQAKRGAAIRA